MAQADRPAEPAPRWNPGARYRPSALAGLPPLEVDVEPLPGRLFRGPARRTAVFDRDLWQGNRAGHGHGHVADALATAAQRYRHGGLDTSGLVRAVAHALAS